MKTKGKGKNRLAFQFMIFFFVSLLLTDFLSFFLIRNVVKDNYLTEKAENINGVELEVEQTLKEYASYEWVLAYMLDHRYEDFDMEYESSEKTKIKISKLLEAHPSMDIMTVTEEELEQYTEAEKKAYTEIVFNRWLLRINDIKKAYDVTFLHFFATDDDYKEDFFIISGSDGKAVRGKQLGNAYVFGTQVTNTKQQTETFRNLKDNVSRLIESDSYLDAYRYMFKIKDMNIIAGMTIEISDVKRNTLLKTLQFLNTFIILEIIFFFIIRYMINHMLIEPLKEVEENVTEYATTKNGKLVRDQLSRIKSKTEIGALADGVSEMTREIEDYLKKIQTVTAENERISADLDMAQKIQTDMLPNTFPAFPDRTEFDIYATMKPAKEVGGDFYDFFMVDDDHLALLIADVSGKGVPAALFMVNAKTLIKNRTLLGGSLSEIFADVSDQLLDINEEGMFVTLWMAVIDIHTGKGVAANAGHEHPVLRSRDGKYELVKYRHSLAIAMIRGVPFEEHSIELKPGDRIFVYTDGLPEARREDGEFYGTTRMLEALNRSGDSDLETLLRDVRREMKDFVAGAEQYDDVTMLAFDFLG
ncbi:MAG TPA: hypothetical protein DEO83_05050 [Lachnospiraceae bacterium]|nr:hypothetical protein [Lachnospiraceae bacterium]